MLNVTQKEFSDEEKEYLRKLHKAVYDKAKEETNRVCLICEKMVSSYCNSHSVPKFCLKNISFGQRLDSLNSIIKQPTSKLEFGAKEAGTFFSICNNCDNTLFEHYENPNNYEQDSISQKMMYEIALKCYVRQIYRHKLQYKYYTDFNIACSFPVEFEVLAQAEAEDSVTFSKEFKKLLARKMSFNLLYYEKLYYKVPIAFQDCICLISDYDGNLINNPYGESKNQQMIFLCVFPLEEGSAIIIFSDAKSNRYSRFIKRFNELSLDNKLKSILFIMLAYSENIFISKTISDFIKKDEKIKEIASFLSLNVNMPRQFATIEAMKQFNLSKAFELENYLGKRYALK